MHYVAIAIIGRPLIYKVPDNMTAGSLSSSSIFLLLGETKLGENTLKLPKFSLMQSVPSIEENLKFYIFEKCYHQRFINFPAHIA